MSNPFFDHPILNSPYEYPRRHWELDAEGQPTQQIIEDRRRGVSTAPARGMVRVRAGGGDSSGDGQSQDGAGNKLTDEQLWTRLAARKMVLISHSREGLDAAYRDVIARDAVVLIMPAPEGGLPIPLPDRAPPERLPPQRLPIEKE